MAEIRKINPETLMKPIKALSNGILVPLGSANILYVSGQTAQDRNGDVIIPSLCMQFYDQNNH